MTFPQAPALPEELDKLMRRMRLPYMRKAAPDVLATARTARPESLCTWLPTVPRRR